MTTRLPESPPPDAGLDILGRKQIATSGIHAGRIAICAALGMAVGLGTYLAGRAPPPAPKAQAGTVVSGPVPSADRAGYASLAAPDPPQRPVLPTPRAPVALALPAAPAQTTGSAKESLRERALAAGIGGWSADQRIAPAPARAGAAEDAQAPGGMPAASPAAAASQAARGLVADMPASQFHRLEGACIVPPATPVQATTLTAVVTEQGGIATALVTRDVWDAAFRCLAVPAGSMVTIEYGPSAARGQKRIEVRNPVIVRPWPRQDMLQPVAMAADAEGASGLPGAVQVPWFRTGLLIAASTAVDLAAAALSDGGSLFGAILGRNIDSPLDRAAKDLLDRAPVLRLEQGQPITLILRGAIQADEFRT